MSRTAVGHVLRFRRRVLNRVPTSATQFIKDDTMVETSITSRSDASVADSPLPAGRSTSSAPHVPDGFPSTRQARGLDLRACPGSTLRRVRARSGRTNAGERALPGARLIDLTDRSVFFARVRKGTGDSSLMRDSRFASPREHDAVRRSGSREPRPLAYWQASSPSRDRYAQ